MRFFLVLFLISSSIYAKYPTLQEMIGQMIMVGVGGSKISNKWVQQLRKDIKKGKVGGIILYKNNIESPKKLKKLITYLSSTKSKYPLFVAIEQEGGKVQGLNKKNGFMDYPSAFDMARYNTLLESYQIYKNLANELKEYGFNINFAPVVDTNINLNSRSYSTEEEIVIAYSNEFLEAQKDAGIISVLKYFPGYGNATRNSHKRLIDVSKTWEYKELKPYYNFIKYQKIDAIIVGHIILDKFDKIYPASLSKKTITGILRNQLRFDGVVFSDNMNMKAISNIYGFKKSVIMAINAGVDVLVYSSYFTKKSSVVNEVTKIVIEAVKNGDIDIKTIENSYSRIKGLKNDID